LKVSTICFVPPMFQKVVKSVGMPMTSPLPAIILTSVRDPVDLLPKETHET